MEPTMLDKLLARREEAKQKKLEKLKAQKEKLKLKKKEEAHKRELKRRREKYRPIHKKNLRKRQNARAYNKRKKALLAQRKAAGDVRGYYRIVLMHNRDQVDELKSAWWLHNAMARFDEYVKKHNDGVICEVRTKRDDKRHDKESHDEILLLKHIDPTVDDGIRSFRNKDGIFVDHIVANNKSYAIINKSDVYTPELFHVYGYNPVTDKKTGRWIYDNIIAKDCSKENFKNVFVMDNKLIIMYNGDFDLVICKDNDTCSRLYEGLRLETGKQKMFVQFTGNATKAMKPKYYDMIQEKTGWNRKVLSSRKT